MTATISGDTGIDKVQDGSIKQEDLGPNVVGTGPAFRAHASSGTIVYPPSTKIMLGVEDANIGGAVDTLNSRVKPTVAGWYQIQGRVGYSTPSYNQYAILYKNGVAHSYGQPGVTDGSCVVDLVYLNGTTDYVELWGYIATAQTCRVEAAITYLSGFLVRAA